LVIQMLKLATWNMNHWKRVHFGGDAEHLAKACRYALGLAVDLLLVQDAVAPLRAASGRR
jgi:hypothetical protein